MASHLPGCRVDPRQAAESRQPDRSGAVLGDVMNRSVEYRRDGWKVGEYFRRRVEPIHTQIGCYPQLSGSIFEKGFHCKAAQAVRIAGLRPEIPEAVAVVALQAVFCAEPQKPQLAHCD